MDFGITLGKSPQFVVFALVVLSVAAGAAYLAVPHIVKDIAQKKFNQEITNQVMVQFQEPRISNVVVAVAGNQASNLMSQAVSPAIHQFETNLVTIQAQLTAIHEEAKTNLDLLKAEADFYSIIAKAQAYDRASYYKLYGVSLNTNNPFWEVANKASVTIADDIKLRTGVMSGMFYKLDAWEGTTNSAASASLQDYINVFENRTEQMMKFFMLRQFYMQTRFPLDDRLKLLMRVINYSDNLLMVNEACRLIADESKIDVDFVAATNLITWWDKRSKGQETKMTGPSQR